MNAPSRPSPPSAPGAAPLPWAQNISSGGPAPAPTERRRPDSTLSSEIKLHSYIMGQVNNLSAGISAFASGGGWVTRRIHQRGVPTMFTKRLEVSQATALAFCLAMLVAPA